jgi:hypothetical protein
MSDLSQYDSKSERLENATDEERIMKYMKIVDAIRKEGINVVGIQGASILLEDVSCNYKLSHGLMSWEVFRVVDVVDMIVSGRNEYLKRINKE